MRVTLVESRYGVGRYSR